MKQLIKVILALTLLLLSLVPLAFADGASEQQLTINVKGPGKIIVDGGAECDHEGCVFTVPANQEVSLEAVPAQSKFTFLGWGNDCSGSENVCRIAIDSDKVVSAEFSSKRALSNKKPYLKKLNRLSTSNLLVETGCGPAPCNLSLSGYLKNKGKRIAIEPVFFRLEANEKRRVNLIKGPDNADVRGAVKNAGRKKSRAQFQITLLNLDNRLSSRMAINEKPSCCWDKPKDKKDKK